MEPFSIACTTCQARLRVRDESVIGQILTCPKCGSMVLVEPVAAANDASHDSSAMHQSDSSEAAGITSAVFEDAASLLDEPDEAAAPESPDMIDTVEDLALQAEARPAAREGNLDEEETGGWRRERTEADEQEDSISPKPSPPPRPTYEEALLPNADWVSPATVQWRNRVLTGIAAVVGVVLALLLFIVFSGGDEPPSVVSRPRTSEAPPNRPAESAPSETSDPVEPPTEVASDDSTSAVLPPAPEPQAPTESPTVNPAEMPAPDATNTAPVPNVTESKPPALPADEPPGLTPKEPTDSTATNAEQSPLSETFRDFGALLAETKEPATPMPAGDEELPLVPGAGETEAEPVARRAGPRTIELDDRLNDPIARIEFKDVPLVNFLKFVSDYSTIPITLDADILRWARISPLTPVTLEAVDSTVADVLARGLAPLALEHRVEGDQLFITRRPKEESGIRTVTFKVDDLVGNDEKQLQQLGSWIKDFVEPESWSSRGGIGTITFRGNELIIEQYETIQFEILGFCEKLRVARGLTKKSPYDASQFQLATRSERVEAKFAQSITLTYIRPAPLQRILDRLAQASKLQILIDWRALGEAGWSPDAEVRFSVADQPLAKALSTLLDPMDLAYRVIDESTLQITTPTVVDSRLEVEFYRVPKPDDDGTKLVQAAREALGPANFRDFGGAGQLAFDQPSNCLLVSLSQTRQRELQTWLAAQAATATSATSSESATPTATVGSRIVPASDRVSND